LASGEPSALGAGSIVHVNGVPAAFITVVGVGFIVVDVDAETSRVTQVWLIANYVQIVGSTEGGLQTCQGYASRR
jgi:hypothetical protein